MTAARKLPIIILFGAPGAGKGTLASLLAKRGYVHCSTGEAMRRWAEGPRPEQRELKAMLAKGQYGSNELAQKIIEEFLASLPASAKGVILDGYPRNLAQFEAWAASGHRALGVIVTVKSTAARHRRLMNRSTCAFDGTSSQGLAGKPCPTCGRLMTSRSDDASMATITARDETFRTAVGPVLDAWRASRPFMLVSNDGDVGDLGRKVTSIMTGARTVMTVPHRAG